MGITLLSVGDSITRGTGATTYNKSYIYQTRVGLLNANHMHYLVNSASGGQRSDNLIDIHKSRGGKCDADLITILVGTNDVVQGASTSTFKTNLGLLIDEIKKRKVRGIGQIVLLTIPWMNNAFTSVVPNYNAIIQQVGTERNIPVCNIYPAFNTSSDLADDVHPNDSGHTKIANILIPFLNNLDVWNNTWSR